MTQIITDNPQNIKGWGVDANPEDLPFYPMKERTDDDNKGMNWVRPSQQHSQVEILKSNERPSLPAVFGTTVPPSGLSGTLRRWAFKRSESSYFHWLPLLLADRINVVEGIIHDLLHGHIPNIPAEMGIKSEMKYNPKGFRRKLLTGAAIVGAIVVLSAYLGSGHDDSQGDDD